MKITENKKNSFLIFLCISFIFHIFLIALLFISSEFLNFFGEEKQFIPPPSIRIDSIGLPDLPSKKKIRAKKKPVLPRPSKTKPLPKEKSKKNLPEKKPETKNKQSPPSKRVEKEESQKGNQLNKEGVKEGTEGISQEALTASATYTHKIIQKIKSNWNLPNYLTEVSLTTQIELKINPDGSIFYKNIYSSSGNNVFDSYVLKAIENSAPYPSPPKIIKKYIQKEGFVLAVPNRN